MKKVLFIDRDGTLILEPEDFKVDQIDKVIFYPNVLFWLRKIALELDYELVMVTNQDGLGTEYFSETEFWKAHRFMERVFKGEQIEFKATHIDKSFPDEGLDTRKPGIGMLKSYFSPEYDLSQSFVIGDRITDVMLAKNLGARCFWLNDGRALGALEINETQASLQPFIALETREWKDIYYFLLQQNRMVNARRVTKETQIEVALNLDGQGVTSIQTGLGFFNHMLEQLGKHSGINLTIEAKGDLHIDEHHTIEDTALALGEAIRSALGKKAGIARYGFVLPMDESLAETALDFSGRPQLVWDVKFKREKIGDMPTELFYHFFKSFCDAALCNLHIKAKGKNEHHKIEAIFKSLALSLKQAITRNGSEIPSTKGVL